jgi:hypothetical protein
MFADEVRQKIEKLRAMDQDLMLFGADHHQYRFNPPLAKMDLMGFEERNRISLPEDYKDFVLNVGNGGAGPCYGIYPLLLDHNVHHGMSGDDRIDVSLPFPHSKDWDEDWPGTIDWDSGQKPDDDLAGEYFDNRHISGALCICHYGCGDFFLLVTHGSERGNIWVDGRRNYSGIFRGGFEDSERGRAISFSRWYVSWLDRSLEQLTGEGRSRVR